MTSQSGLWMPPTQFGAIQPRIQQSPPLLGPIYRWRNGQVARIASAAAVPANTPPLSTSRNNPLHYRTVTVFCQQQPAFFAVNFDARREAVQNSDLGGWIELGFQHTPLAHSSSRVYSYIDFAGEHSQLAAPAAPTSRWIPQLFPHQYHWTADVGEPNQTNAGLIGQLPLIISLAAFSCAPQHVDHILTNCIQPGAWYPHHGNHGRTAL